MSAETSESATCKWLSPHNLTIRYNESLNLTLEVTNSTDCGQRDSSIHLFTSASRDPLDCVISDLIDRSKTVSDTRNETCVENHTFRIKMTPKVHEVLHGVVFAKNCDSIGVHAIRYYIINDSSKLIIEYYCAVTYCTLML